MASGGSITGLDFPSKAAVSGDVRFKFTGSALLPIQPATYIWNLYPKQQPGYHVTFFHAQEVLPTRNYYGAHPYPKTPPNGNTHWWEVAANMNDYTADAGGNDTTVQWNRWYTQAFVVSNGEITFYWDLPNTSRRISVTAPGLQGGSGQALSFGAAPWAYWDERLYGVLRGLRLYSASLSLDDILSEANSPLSTSAGSAAIWYLNMNPTPDDISDKSGRGHHPTWASSTRPTLWQQ